MQSRFKTLESNVLTKVIADIRKQLKSTENEIRSKPYIDEKAEQKREFLSKSLEYAELEAAQRRMNISSRHQSVEHEVLTRSDPDITKRRAVVAQNLDATDQDICKRFDFASIPVVGGWNASGWAEAYRNKILRPKIHTLISKHRHELRSR